MGILKSSIHLPSCKLAVPTHTGYTLVENVFVLPCCVHVEGIDNADIMGELYRQVVHT
jgi:hypothetical protein